MPYLKKTNVVLQHPTEPDVTVTIRLPLTGGNFEGHSVASDIVASAIVEWSYDAPISGETIRDLDRDTYRWLLDESWSRSDVRTEQEKKASATASSPTSAPEKEDSPASSPI